MKFKYLYLFIICSIIGISSASASSIEYNLTIDENMNFTENNIYKVKETELEKSNSYDFLTSVVKDSIYFNEDNKVKYTKSRKYSNGVYTVTLKNKYSPVFLTGSRIIQECFSKTNYDYTDDYISITTSSPFYCLHRADSIQINIKTSLNVISNNADSKSNNTYIWTPKDKDFELSFKVSKKTESDSKDNSPGETGATGNTDTVDTSTKEEKTKKSPLSIIITIVVLGIACIILLIVLKNLKNKKDNLNQI